MEWKKVKTILLCVLVCTNIFLAGNIWLQIAQNRNEQRTAFRLALDMLSQTVGDFDREIFKGAQKRDISYSVLRDETLESSLAKALISSDSIGTAGGGIHFFTSSKGKATFRNGGVIDISWLETKPDKAPQDFFKETLSKAGLNMKEINIKPGEGSVIFSQELNGKSIENAKIGCEYKNGKCAVSGRWVQGKTAERAGCKTGYEMLIALNDYCGENEIKTPPQGMEVVYFADGNDDGEIILTPAWKINGENYAFYLSCETGKERIFDAAAAQK